MHLRLASSLFIDTNNDIAHSETVIEPATGNLGRAHRRRRSYGLRCSD